MSPPVTLLLMTYNQAPFLAEAIASALAQSGPPLEVFISDNGSTDATPAIIAEAVQRYRGPHQVRSHRFPVNLGGPAQHLNAAWPLTKGHCLVLQAGDDLSLPERAVTTADAFTADQALRCLYSDVEVIDAGGAPLRRAAQGAPPPGADPQAWFARVQAFALGACLAVDRALMSEFPPLHPQVFEDQTLPFRAALAGRVRHLSQVLVRYRLHGDNASQGSRHLESAAAAREIAQVSLARMRTIAALRGSDLAWWQARHPLPQELVQRLRREIASSLHHAEVATRLQVAPLPGRLAAAARMAVLEASPRGAALAFFQATLPERYLAWRRRQQGAR